MPLDASTQFSAKARIYDRFRWPYDPQAVDALLAYAGLSGRETVADIGAGTGMLSALLADRFARVLAVEPCAEMLEQLKALSARYPTIEPVVGSAEATGLEEGCADLVCVGRALHWFDPAPARSEMWRITSAPRWLAVFSVPCTDRELLAALRELRRPELGWKMDLDKHSSGKAQIRWEDYFASGSHRRFEFPAVVEETWAQFCGRISSLSPAPDPVAPAFGRFEAALRDVFDRFSEGGLLSVRIATELVAGRLRPD